MDKTLDYDSGRHKEGVGKSPLELKVMEITAARRTEWNGFLAQQPFFVFMQAWEWGEFKERSGWKAVRLAVERGGEIIAGAQILVKPLGPLSIAYVPRGPLVDWDDEPVVQLLLSAMHAPARHYRAISLKIEPAIPYSPLLKQHLEALEFQESKFSNQPQCSMLVDLTLNEEGLMAKMNKTTRYNIRYSARNGVQIREATEADFETFYEALTFTSKRGDFSVRSKGYYREQWKSLAAKGQVKLFLATYQGEVLAARMAASFGDKAATLHSGSFDKQMKLKPNELLMWACMQWAKSQGCTLYDLWGIPKEVGEHLHTGAPLPQDQKGDLWGVYQFKRGFGGEVIYYVGTFDYVYSPLFYRLMNLALTRLGSFDKLAKVGDSILDKPGRWPKLLRRTVFLIGPLFVGMAWLTSCLQ